MKSFLLNKVNSDKWPSIINLDQSKRKVEVDLVSPATVHLQDVWFATAWQISSVQVARKFTTAQSSVRYELNKQTCHTQTVKADKWFVVIIFYGQSKEWMAVSSMNVYFNKYTLIELCSLHMVFYG